MNIPLKGLWYDLGGFNQQLFSWIYGKGNEYLLWAMPFLDYVGDYKHFPYLLGAAITILMLKFCYGYLIKQSSGTYTMRSSASWLLALVTSFALIFVIVGGLKTYLPLPRPYVNFDGHNAVALLFGTPDAGDEYKSFPSGHVAFITMWCILLWTQVPGILKPLLLISPLAMMWFRVSTGAHFPIDVVASVIIASSCTLIIRDVYRRMFHVWQ